MTAVDRPFPVPLPLVAFGFALVACAHASPAVEAPTRVTVDAPPRTAAIAASEPISPTRSSATYGELPDGWPAAIPVIDGGRVVSKMSSVIEKRTGLAATIESSEPTETLLAFYREKITADGYTETAHNELKADGLVLTSVAFQKGAGAFVSISVTSSRSDTSTRTVSISVTVLHL